MYLSSASPRCSEYAAGAIHPPTVRGARLSPGTRSGGRAGGPEVVTECWGEVITSRKMPDRFKQQEIEPHMFPECT